MVFSYYNKLSPAGKRVYRQSDEIHTIEMPNVRILQPLIPLLAAALKEEDRAAVESLCRDLAKGITNGLRVPSLRIRVLTEGFYKRESSLFHQLVPPATVREP